MTTATDEELKIKPLLDRVIIQPFPDEEMIGRIYVPQSDEGRSRKGRVLAVGPGKVDITDGVVTSIPMSVKVGDVVIYGYFAGRKIDDFDRLSPVILADDQCFAVVEE